MKSKLVLALFLVSPFIINAEHILGGFITYEHLQFNEYSFEMRLYRDCDSEGPEFDDPSALTLYRQIGSDYFVFINIEVYIAGTINTFFAAEDDCMNLNFPFCIEEAIYVIEVNLPPVPINNKYHIIYQRCCKVTHFSNILTSGDIGITLATEITYEADQLLNSSPILNPSNFFKVCVGEEFNFDISANDINSNQIVYELCTPIVGGGGLAGSDQNPGDAESCDGVTPTPACPPPFEEVEFILPTYSATSPLGTNSTLELDSETGEISGVANIVGQFLVGICVKEYDNGQLISESHQDLVFRADFFIDTSEPEVDKLSFFPNPAKDLIYIDLPDHSANFELFVRDINGRLVKHISNISGADYELELETLKGLYFIELRSSQNIYLEKLIVM